MVYLVKSKCTPKVLVLLSAHCNNSNTLTDRNILFFPFHKPRENIVGF